MTALERQQALAALAWLVAVGADEAVDDVPRDRLRAAERPAPSPPPNLLHQGGGTPVEAGVVGGEPHPIRAPVPLGTPEGVATARALAAAATTLEALKEAIARFDGLSIKGTATNLVFADGNPEAKLMLIGEAPGGEEDRRGLPFVGPAGQLLDRMLAAIGHDRANSYITNIVNWRPPGNRKPSPAEMLLCQPFIERHIALVNPAVLVFLGDTAAKTLTGRSEGITRLRGRWFDWTNPMTGAAIPAMPTFHPAYLLRSPGQKREAWMDLLAIRRKLAEARSG